jgi:FkbM family methyltransferase
MPVKGFARYLRLIKHIQNPGEYLFHKGNIKFRSMRFTTKPNHISFNVAESVYQVFKEIFMADVYEIDHLVNKLPVGPLVIDIGANVGFFDFLLLSKLEKALIYSYEPLKSNIEKLEETVKANPSIKKNIFINQLAVTGNAKEYLELFSEDTQDNQVVASVFSDFNPNNIKSIRVPCITLTDIIQKNGFNKIDLLKMDCEGSEYDIIYNTSKDLIKLIDKMVIEVHDVDTEKNNVIYFSDYLRQLGFTVKHQPINNFCHALEAEKLG